MKLKGRQLPRGQSGYAVLVPEHGRLLSILPLQLHVGEDLWHVYALVREGDIVSAVTHRKVVREGAKGNESETLRLKLAVKVESVDFDADGQEIRLKGRNLTENEHVKLGAYHTLVLVPSK